VDCKAETLGGGKSEEQKLCSKGKVKREKKYVAVSERVCSGGLDGNMGRGGK